MLENATRICGAKFGNAVPLRWGALRGGRHARRSAGLRRVLAARPASAWPGHPLGRIARTRQMVHIVDVAADPAYIERDPTLRRPVVQLGGIRTLLVVPMLKENELIGAIVIYRQEVRAVHRQADRAGDELRRPGGDRHREHAAAQRAAAAHRRSVRGAGAADRDLRGAAGHLEFARRARAGVRGHAGERDAHL